MRTCALGLTEGSWVEKVSSSVIFRSCAPAPSLATSLEASPKCARLLQESWEQFVQPPTSRPPMLLPHAFCTSGRRNTGHPAGAMRCRPSGCMCTDLPLGVA